MMAAQDGHVECDECGRGGEIEWPRVDLMGQSIVYTNPDDPDSMYLVLADSAVCQDCLEEDY